MKITARIALALLPFSLVLINLAGCSHNNRGDDDGSTNAPIAQKLTPAQLQQKIQDIQNNKKIPEGAKPQIIQQLQAQAAPAQK